MATTVTLSGLSELYPADELETLVRTAGDAVGGDLDDLSSRQVQLALSVYQRMQREMDDIHTGDASQQSPCESNVDSAAPGRRVTVGELIERLRRFPQDLEVWLADPAGPEGYTPLDGTVGLGDDPDPTPGDPSSFVVIGLDDGSMALMTPAPSTARPAGDKQPATIDGDLRGCMADGYDQHLVNEILVRISDLTGVRVVCLWDYHDAFGFDGHSDFYVVEQGGVLRELTGDLWLWLNGAAADASTPASPGAPSTWIGSLTDLAPDELYSGHNYAREVR